MLQKEQFRPYTLPEERNDRYGKPISVRLNGQERAWLEEIKEDLNIKSDSKALKMAAFIGKNVLQSLLTRRMLRYLFKNERDKLENHKSF